MRTESLTQLKNSTGKKPVKDPRYNQNQQQIYWANLLSCSKLLRTSIKQIHTPIQTFHFLEYLAGCFLVTSVLRFALLPYYRRIIDFEHI